MMKSKIEGPLTAEHRSGDQGLVSSMHKSLRPGLEACFCTTTTYWLCDLFTPHFSDWQQSILPGYENSVAHLHNALRPS